MRTIKRKVMKSVTGIILALSIILSWSVTGTAMESEDSSGMISPMSIDATKVVSLSLSANEATAACNVRGEAGKVTKIAITMYLQKKSSSGTWTNFKTWSGSKSSYSYSLRQTCLVSRGTYRVKAKVTCYQGSTTQTTYHYSASKLY